MWPVTRPRTNTRRPEIEPLEPRALLAAIEVTSTADAGPGSLRAAISAVNRLSGPNTVTFDLPGVGPFVIAPDSALPAVRGGTTIDGTSQPGYAGTPLVELAGGSAGAAVDGLRLVGGRSTVRGLIVGGFGGDGIAITGRGGDRLIGNQVGGRPDGSSSANGGAGVRITNSASNRVGGSLPGLGNRISSNGGPGVIVAGRGSVGNQVQGNQIGTDPSGIATRANGGAGVLVQGATRTEVGGTGAGQGNVIAYNLGAGVRVPSGRGTAVTDNSIFANGGPGIDRGPAGLSPTGVAGVPGAPVLTSSGTVDGVTTVTGRVTGRPNSTVRVDVYATNRNLLASSGAAGGRSQVLEFDGGTGAFLGVFGAGSGVVDPRDIAPVPPNGEQVVVSNGDDRQLEFDSRTSAFLGTFVAQAGLNPGGAFFGPNGNEFVAARTRAAVAEFNGTTGAFLGDFIPSGQVAFPRGSRFGPNGDFFLANGASPATGAGGGTVLQFDGQGNLVNPNFITDSALSPLALVIGPTGHLLITSEFPFGAANSAGTVREYDSNTGALLRVLGAGVGPDGQPILSRPRGLVIGPDGTLYVSSTGNGRVVRFDLNTGALLGVFAALPGLNAQAVTFVAPDPAGSVGGRTLLGSTTARIGRSGQAAFTLQSLVPAAGGGQITATDQPRAGDTSEFSAAILNVLA